MFYLDNRTKNKFTQYDGHHPDPQVMDDKKMLHLAKSSTVSVRFQPEILNGNLSILYVVSPFTIIINSFIHNYLQWIPFNLLGSMWWAKHLQLSSWKDNVWDNLQLSSWKYNVCNATKVLSDNISLHCNYLANPSSTAQTVWFRYLLWSLILGQNKFTMPNCGTNQLSLQ